MKRMMIMEEAHEILGGQTNKRMADLKESTATGILRDLRKTDTCGIVISQLIEDIDRSLLGNIGTIFCLRQPHRNSVRMAGAMLNLEPWQEPELAQLPQRHAIVRLRRHKEPIYLEIKDAWAWFPEDRHIPSREEARARSRKVLDAIPFIKRPAPQRVMSPLPPVEETKPDQKVVPEGGLYPRDLQVFARITSYPWELIDDRKDALGLDRDLEGEIRKKLETCGLTGFAGMVGAKNRLFELTEKGKEFAQVRGIPLAKMGKGGTVHESIIEYTQRSLKKCFPDAAFRRAGVSQTTGGVQPDLLILMRDGIRITFQACYQNQPAYEASAMMALGRLAEAGSENAERMEWVVAVAANKRHKAAMERAVKGQNRGRLPTWLILQDFDTITAPDWDWGLVFERLSGEAGEELEGFL